jgi:flagellar biosynthesis protein FliQ
MVFLVKGLHAIISENQPKWIPYIVPMVGCFFQGNLIKNEMIAFFKNIVSNITNRVKHPAKIGRGLCPSEFL